MSSAEAASPSQSRELVKWSDRFNTDIHEVDEQHQALVALLNQLFTAIFENRGVQASGEILDRLTDYTETHFSLEESLMRISAYPDFSAHKGQHAEFVAQVQDLRQKIKTENAPISFELLRFLRNWLLSHIDESDKRFGQFYRQGGHAHYAEWQQEVKKTLEKKKWWQFW